MVNGMSLKDDPVHLGPAIRLKAIIEMPFPSLIDEDNVFRGQVSTVEILRHQVGYIEHAECPIKGIGMVFCFNG